MLSLRPYQTKAIDDMTKALLADRAQGKRHAGICDAAVGAGKSILMAKMAEIETEQHDGRVLILANVMELVQQDAEKYMLATGSAPDVYQAAMGRRETGGLVVVAGVQSLARNLDACGKFSLILADEAHGINPNQEGQYRAIIDHQGCDIIGFTGTPWRLKSGPIYGRDRLFDGITTRISISELQEMGFLARERYKAKDIIGEVHKDFAGEYRTAEQEGQIIYDDVIEAIASHTVNRKSVLIFVPGVDSGYELVQRIRQAGIGQCAAIFGETSDEQRQKIAEDYKRGTLRFLVNCGTLTTGFDAPRTDCIILLRKTASSSLLCQMAGRGLRIHPDKQDVLILDYAGNFLEHPSVPDLGPTEKGREPKPKRERVCPKCDELVPYSKDACPQCGLVFPKVGQDRTLQFKGKAIEPQGSLDDAAKFAKMAANAKARSHQPVAALIKYKEAHGKWPSTRLGVKAGHPFEWTMQNGKRTVIWK